MVEANRLGIEILF